MKFLSKHFQHILLGSLVMLVVWSGYNPSNWTVWWAEMIPVLLVGSAFAFTYKKFTFSNLAYFFASFWLIMHTIGAHYTFEYVPFDWFTDFFGFERNHYDRIAHFAIGFYAFPIAEYISRKKLISVKSMIFLFALFAIVTLAAFYEIIEWQFAIIYGGDEAGSFLGSQGDIWDAQKDILMDTLGALFSLMFFVLCQNNKLTLKI